MNNEQSMWTPSRAERTAVVYEHTQIYTANMNQNSAHGRAEGQAGANGLAFAYTPSPNGRGWRRHENAMWGGSADINHDTHGYDNDYRDAHNAKTDGERTREAPQQAMPAVWAATEDLHHPRSSSPSWHNEGNGTTDKRYRRTENRDNGETQKEREREDELIAMAFRGLRARHLSPSPRGGSSYPHAKKAAPPLPSSSSVSPQRRPQLEVKKPLWNGRTATSPSPNILLRRAEHHQQTPPAKRPNNNYNHLPHRHPINTAPIVTQKESEEQLIQKDIGGGGGGPREFYLKPSATATFRVGTDGRPSYLQRQDPSDPDRKVVGDETRGNVKSYRKDASANEERDRVGRDEGDVSRGTQRRSVSPSPSPTPAASTSTPRDPPTSSPPVNTCTASAARTHWSRRSRSDPAIQAAQYGGASHPPQRRTPPSSPVQQRAKSGGDNTLDREQREYSSRSSPHFTTHHHHRPANTIATSSTTMAPPDSASALVAPLLPGWMESLVRVSFSGAKHALASALERQQTRSTTACANPQISPVTASSSLNRLEEKEVHKKGVGVAEGHEQEIDDQRSQERESSKKSKERVSEEGEESTPDMQHLYVAEEALRSLELEYNELTNKIFKVLFAYPSYDESELMRVAELYKEGGKATHKKEETYLARAVASHRVSPQKHLTPQGLLRIANASLQQFLNSCDNALTLASQLRGILDQPQQGQEKGGVGPEGGRKGTKFASEYADTTCKPNATAAGGVSRSRSISPASAQIKSHSVAKDGNSNNKKIVGILRNRNLALESKLADTLDRLHGAEREVRRLKKESRLHDDTEIINYVRARSVEVKAEAAEEMRERKGGGGRNEDPSRRRSRHSTSSNGSDILHVFAPLPHPDAYSVVGSTNILIQSRRSSTSTSIVGKDAAILNAVAALAAVDEGVDREDVASSSSSSPLLPSPVLKTMLFPNSNNSNAAESIIDAPASAARSEKEQQRRSRQQEGGVSSRSNSNKRPPPESDPHEHAAAGLTVSGECPPRRRKPDTEEEWSRSAEDHRWEVPTSLTPVVEHLPAGTTIMENRTPLTFSVGDRSESYGKYSRQSSQQHRQYQIEKLEWLTQMQAFEREYAAKEGKLLARQRLLDRREAELRKREDVEEKGEDGREKQQKPLNENGAKRTHLHHRPDPPVLATAAPSPKNGYPTPPPNDRHHHPSTQSKQLKNITTTSTISAPVHREDIITAEEDYDDDYEEGREIEVREEERDGEESKRSKSQEDGQGKERDSSRGGGTSEENLVFISETPSKAEEDEDESRRKTNNNTMAIMTTTMMLDQLNKSNAATAPLSATITQQRALGESVVHVDLISDDEQKRGILMSSAHVPSERRHFDAHDARESGGVATAIFGGGVEEDNLAKDGAEKRALGSNPRVPPPPPRLPSPKRNRNAIPSSAAKRDDEESSSPLSFHLASPSSSSPALAPSPLHDTPTPTPRPRPSYEDSKSLPSVAVVGVGKVLVCSEEKEATCTTASGAEEGAEMREQTSSTNYFPSSMNPTPTPRPALATEPSKPPLSLPSSASSVPSPPASEETHASPNIQTTQDVKEEKEVGSARKTDMLGGNPSSSISPSFAPPMPKRRGRAGIGASSSNNSRQDTCCTPSPSAALTLLDAVHSSPLRRFMKAKEGGKEGEKETDKEGDALAVVTAGPETAEAVVSDSGDGAVIGSPQDIATLPIGTLNLALGDPSSDSQHRNEAKMTLSRRHSIDNQPSRAPTSTSIKNATTISSSSSSTAATVTTSCTTTTVKTIETLMSQRKGPDTCSNSILSREFATPPRSRPPPTTTTISNMNPAAAGSTPEISGRGSRLHTPLSSRQTTPLRGGHPSSAVDDGNGKVQRGLGPTLPVNLNKQQVPQTTLDDTERGKGQQEQPKDYSSNGVPVTPVNHKEFLPPPPPSERPPPSPRGGKGAEAFVVVGDTSTKRLSTPIRTPPRMPRAGTIQRDSRDSSRVDSRAIRPPHEVPPPPSPAKLPKAMPISELVGIYSSRSAINTTQQPNSLHTGNNSIPHSKTPPEAVLDNGDDGDHRYDELPPLVVPQLGTKRSPLPPPPPRRRARALGDDGESEEQKEQKEEGPRTVTTSYQNTNTTVVEKSDAYSVPSAGAECSESTHNQHASQSNRSVANVEKRREAVNEPMRAPPPPPARLHRPPRQEAQQKTTTEPDDGKNTSEDKIVETLQTTEYDYTYVFKEANNLATLADSGTAANNVAAVGTPRRAPPKPPQPPPR